VPDPTLHQRKYLAIALSYPPESKRLWVISDMLTLAKQHSCTVVADIHEVPVQVSPKSDAIDVLDRLKYAEAVLEAERVTVGTEVKECPTPS
jgi:hypothetical protein